MFNIIINKMPMVPERRIAWNFAQDYCHYLILNLKNIDFLLIYAKYDQALLIIENMISQLSKVIEDRLGLEKVTSLKEKLVLIQEKQKKIKILNCRPQTITTNQKKIILNSDIKINIHILYEEIMSYLYQCEIMFPVEINNKNQDLPVYEDEEDDFN